MEIRQKTALEIGRLVISLYKHNGQVVFKVVDQGIGVPRSEQHQLFTKFYRASNAKKSRPDGTGVGLYVARKVIVAHGGSIIFDSKEGIGSTFGFRLPIKPTGVFPKTQRDVPFLCRENPCGHGSRPLCFMVDCG